ncbi:acyl carrier protein [Saccharomonospora amisosensis]|uniref:Acyl carrier protein n=1 Tax=Saccharomonospora amisosensis TaxID=1128677 RepID=A0A7X5UPK7_9PSEU|nr:acyl carrier protein [Saccharomonospora amisosensis]NIJ11883.1 acyl carrier protein [Saccharomonospora amisosensis]
MDNNSDTSREAIVAWCQEYIAGLIDVEPAAVDPAADFDRLGIDSALAVSLLIEVEQRYGVDLAPEDLFDNPTLNAVADHLHAHTQRTVA